MAKATEKTEEKAITKEEYLKEKVPCQIIRPEGVNTGFATITVNGYNYQIEYNRTVYVPRFVAEVIENSYKATREADKRKDEFLDLFNQKAGVLA